MTEEAGLLTTPLNSGFKEKGSNTDRVVLLQEPDAWRAFIRASPALKKKGNGRRDGVFLNIAKEQDFRACIYNKYWDVCFHGATSHSSQS